jgi:hypothetical protein
MTDYERQIVIDEEHLRLLAIGYWVWGGFMAVYALLLGAYFGVIGSVFVMIPGGGAEGPPAFMGWIFLCIGAVVLVVVGALAALEIATGFWIHRRRHRVATLVVAALLCPSVPFGTLLGVSTFVVMSRPSVKARYLPPGTILDGTGAAQ